MDVDSVGLGEDFVKTIEETVGSCDVLIAVIGAHWLTSTDGQGGRRVDNPEDFVRMEIATALRRNIRVIPVLVDGALMPQSADLPDDLKPLVRRNALQVGDTHFDDDCRRMVAAIEQVLEKIAAGRREREEKDRPEAERQRAEQERLEHGPQAQPPSEVAPSTTPAKPEADKLSSETPKVVYPLPPKPAEPGREKPPKPSLGGTGGKRPSKQVIAFLTAAAVLLVGGLVYLTIKLHQPPSPQPAPVSASPSQVVIATSTPAPTRLSFPSATRLGELTVEEIRNALTKSVAKQNNDPNADEQILISQDLDPAKIPGQSFATKVIEAYKSNPGSQLILGWKVVALVNGKNGFAAYTGFKPYLFMIRDGAIVFEADGETEMNSALLEGY